MIEGDEYDCAFFDKRPKFVHYLPNVAIIGNVEFDHADIYADLAAVQLAFVRLLNVVPRSGLLVAGTESPALVRDPAEGPLPGRDVRPARGRRLAGRGRADRARRHAVPARSGGGGTRASSRSPLGGEHNVRNALAALAAAAEAGVEPGAAREALAALPGGQAPARGRGARRAASRSTTTSPTTRRRWRPPSRRCAPSAAAGASWRCSSRAPTPRKTRAFQDGFARAFAGADRVIVAAAHLPGKVPEGQRLSEAELVAGIAPAGTEAAFVPTVDAIVEALVAEAPPGRPGRDPLERGLRRHPRQAAPSPRSRRAHLNLPAGQTLWNRRCVRAITSRSFIPSICLLRCVNALPTPHGGRRHGHI